ncbi:MAG: hypothetical protein GY694_13725 [Gammaproteobacteria bacterium]|nr:hypothetical protein [Gammaproteobacteria bacterium]
MEIKGRYICAAAGSPPVVVTGRADLLDENNCVDFPFWHQVKKTLCATYYRNYTEQKKIPVPTPVEDDTDHQNDPMDRLDFEIN